MKWLNGQSSDTWALGSFPTAEAKRPGLLPSLATAHSMDHRLVLCFTAVPKQVPSKYEHHSITGCSTSRNRTRGSTTGNPWGAISLIFNKRLRVHQIMTCPLNLGLPQTALDPRCAVVMCSVCHEVAILQLPNLVRQPEHTALGPISLQITRSCEVVRGHVRPKSQAPRGVVTHEVHFTSPARFTDSLRWDAS